MIGSWDFRRHLEEHPEIVCHGRFRNLGFYMVSFHRRLHCADGCSEWINEFVIKQDITCLNSLNTMDTKIHVAHIMYMSLHLRVLQNLL